LNLLDEAGEQAVTYRSLAKALRVTPMAIKHHVGSREQLFKSLVDEVYKKMEFMPSTKGPVNRILNLLESYSETALSHPNLTLYILSDPKLYQGPIEELTKSIESELGILIENSLEAKTVFDILIDYTHGFALSVASSINASVGGPITVSKLKADYLQRLKWILLAASRHS